MSLIIQCKTVLKNHWVLFLGLLSCFLYTTPGPGATISIRISTFEFAALALLCSYYVRWRSGQNSVSAWWLLLALIPITNSALQLIFSDSYRLNTLILYTIKMTYSIVLMVVAVEYFKHRPFWRENALLLFLLLAVATIAVIISNWVEWEYRSIDHLRSLTNFILLALLFLFFQAAYARRHLGTSIAYIFAAFGTLLMMNFASISGYTFCVLLLLASSSLLFVDKQLSLLKQGSLLTVVLVVIMVTEASLAGIDYVHPGYEVQQIYQPDPDMMEDASIEEIGLYEFVKRKTSWHAGVFSRLLMWEQGIKSIGEHPVLGIGVGHQPEGLADALRPYNWHRKKSLHNTVISLMAHIGLFSLPIIAFLLALSLRSFWRLPPFVALNFNAILWSVLLLRTVIGIQPFVIWLAIMTVQIAYYRDNDTS